MLLLYVTYSFIWISLYEEIYDYFCYEHARIKWLLVFPVILFKLTWEHGFSSV